MTETYPSGLPYEHLEGTFRLLEPFRPNLTTPFEGGKQRQRPSTTKNIARVQYAIKFSNAEFDVFKAWVREVLVNGTLPFTTFVWTGSAYEQRTCTLVDGAYQDDPGGGFYHETAITLDVEDY